MIIVDSSVWIDYFNGVKNIAVTRLDTILGRQLVGIGDLILVEVLQGFSSEKEFQKAQKFFQSLDCFQMCDPNLAILAAQNFRLLKKKGITIRKTIDTVIATFCIAHNFPLLHNDRDFDSFAEFFGLQIV